jgi:hypothetical protein
MDVDEWDWTLKEVVVAYSRHCSDIYRQEMRKTSKNLSQGTLYSGRGSNRTPAKYEHYRYVALLGN